LQARYKNAGRFQKKGKLPLPFPEITFFQLNTFIHQRTEKSFSVAYSAET
jgi:hypothetical protein